MVRAEQLAADLTRARPFAVAVCLLTLSGCQLFRPDPPSPVPADPLLAAVAPDYPVCFPDVIELVVAGRSDCSGTRLVYPDGRLDLGSAGQVFAEGCTAMELTRRIADKLDVPAQQVWCHVAAARSRVVYVVGTGAARPQAVPYRGPERATDLIRRTGELSADAGEVRVVRRNVARGSATETYKVNLAAIRQGDVRTDVVLLPNDEVHVLMESGVRLAALFP